MDYYNHLQRDNFCKDDSSRNNYNGAEEKKVEQFTIQQIELYIQQQVKNILKNFNKNKNTKFKIFILKKMGKFIFFIFMNYFFDFKFYFIKIY